MSAAGHKHKPNVEPGHCPFKPGDLKTELSDSFNPHNLEGPWINLVDEVENN